MHQCNDCEKVFNPGQNEDSISPAVQCPDCYSYHTQPYRDQPSPTVSDMAPRNMPDAASDDRDDQGGNPLQEGIMGDYQNRQVRDEVFARTHISLFETPEFATEEIIAPPDLYDFGRRVEQRHRAEVQTPEGITDNLHAALGNLGAWVGNPQENGQLRPYNEYWQTIRPSSMKPGSIQIGVADPLMGEIINHVANTDDLTPLYEYRGRTSHTKTAGPLVGLGLGEGAAALLGGGAADAAAGAAAADTAAGLAGGAEAAGTAGAAEAAGGAAGLPSAGEALQGEVLPPETPGSALVPSGAPTIDGTATDQPALGAGSDSTGEGASAGGVGGFMNKVMQGVPRGIGVGLGEKALGLGINSLDDIFGLGGGQGGQQNAGMPVQDVSYYAHTAASEDDIFPDSHNEIPKHEDGDYAQQDDGNHHEWQRDISVDDQGGGGLHAPSFDIAGPGMQRFMALLPLLLQMVQNGEDGSNDPLIRGLHESLEAEVPGYLDHADDNAAHKLIMVLQGGPKEDEAATNESDHTDENSGGAKEAKVASMHDLTQIAELRQGLPAHIQHQIDQVLLSEGPIAALHYLQQQGAAPPPPPMGSGIDLGGDDFGVWASVRVGDTSAGDFLPDLEPVLPRFAAGPMDPGGMPIAPPPGPPGPPGAMGGPPAMPGPPAGPPAGAPSSQGPVTDEQQAWFAQWLQQQGRGDEIETMLQDPALYAKEFARARGRELPPEGPQDGLSAEPPMPPQEEAPPGDTMPVPGMSVGPQMMAAVNKYAADSVASKCPNCGSHTTELLDEEGNSHCHGCGHHFKTKGKTPKTLTTSNFIYQPWNTTGTTASSGNTVWLNFTPNTASTWNVDKDPDQGASRQVTAAPDTHTFDMGSLDGDDSVVQGIPAADRYQREDKRLEQDSGHTWTDLDGNPLKVGSSYEMYSKGYDIPDLVRIEAVKPSTVNYTIVGEYGLRHSTELSKQEANLEGLKFKAADTMDSLGLDDGSIEENNDDNTAYTGSPETRDLSAPHGMVSARVNPSLAWLADGGFGKSAGANYTPMEQRALIDERGTARNSDRLDLANTHYIQDAEEDQFLFGL